MGRALVAGVVARGGPQLVGARAQAVVVDLGREAASVEPRGKRPPRLRAGRAQLDLTARDARDAVGDGHRDAARILATGALERQGRRRAVEAQRDGRRGEPLVDVPGLVRAPHLDRPCTRPRHGHLGQPVDPGRGALAAHALVRAGTAQAVVRRGDRCVVLGRGVPADVECVAAAPAGTALDVRLDDSGRRVVDVRGRRVRAAVGAGVDDLERDRMDAVRDAGGVHRQLAPGLRARRHARVVAGGDVLRVLPADGQRHLTDARAVVGLVAQRLHAAHPGPAGIPEADLAERGRQNVVHGDQRPGEQVDGRLVRRRLVGVGWQQRARVRGTAPDHERDRLRLTQLSHDSAEPRELVALLAGVHSREHAFARPDPDRPAAVGSLVAAEELELLEAGAHGRRERGDAVAPLGTDPP